MNKNLKLGLQPLILSLGLIPSIYAAMHPLHMTYVDSYVDINQSSVDVNNMDVNEYGTSDRPFRCIQTAINAADDGTIIIVQSGTYRETIDFLGKNIKLIGNNPDNPILSYAVIDGNGIGPVVTFQNGEDPNCTLQGFCITGGQGDSAGAILCQESSPTIKQCVIVGNRSTTGDSGAVYCYGSNAIITHCTISGNICGSNGAGVYCVDSNIVLTNSILWDNSPDETRFERNSRPLMTYNHIAGQWTDYNTPYADPLFVKPGLWAESNEPNRPADLYWIKGDYHLQSKTGHWDSQQQIWIQDPCMSPCIDAGNPTYAIGYEVLPHHDVVNVGAYGGSAEAGKSFHENQVYFSDSVLKTVVTQTLGHGYITPTDMFTLTILDCNDLSEDLTKLTGLEYAVNLVTLGLSHCEENADIKPLEGLTNLTTLHLDNNKIRDISPLSRLTKLRHLDLHDNNVSDLSPLSGMVQLKTLKLYWNHVSDLSVLSKFKDLEIFNMHHTQAEGPVDISPLTQLFALQKVNIIYLELFPEACAYHIPLIQANNPGVEITLLHLVCP